MFDGRATLMNFAYCYPAPRLARWTDGILGGSMLPERLMLGGGWAR